MGDSFGEILHTVRLAAGKSVAWLAEHSGLTRAYIYELERDHNKPSLLSAGKLAHALGLTVDELCRYELPRLEPKPTREDLANGINRFLCAFGDLESMLQDYNNSNLLLAIDPVVICDADGAL